MAENQNSGNNEETRIRKEWLQFKGALFDRLADFPTIPIIVDDVRKNIGHHKSLIRVPCLQDISKISNMVENLWNFLQKYQSNFQ